MTPGAVAASLERMMDSRGEAVTVRRYSGAGAARVPFECTARAVAMGAAADDLAGSVQQADRKLVLLAGDLTAAGFPIPLVVGDKIVLRGRELRIEALDDSTRRVAGILIAYELTVRG